jgi:protein SCO1/2
MKFLVLCTAAISIILASCGSENPENPGVVSNKGGVERLMKYYPLPDHTPEKPHYHTIPVDTFQAHTGSVFVTDRLKGVVTVSDFFFAECGGICPKMSSQLERVQAAFKNKKDFRIVSYTVDPESDSVAALQEYAFGYQADTAMWNFVTGKKKNLYDLARHGYFLPVEPGNGDSEDFIHSDQFVLTDRNGIIRGYYTGTDSTAVDSLIQDIRFLLNEK